MKTENRLTLLDMFFFNGQLWGPMPPPPPTIVSSPIIMKFGTGVKLDLEVFWGAFSNINSDFTFKNF